MNPIGTPLQWGVFFTLVGVMLALDLGVFRGGSSRSNPVSASTGNIGDTGDIEALS